MLSTSALPPLSVDWQRTTNHNVAASILTTTENNLAARKLRSRRQRLSISDAEK